MPHLEETVLTVATLVGISLLAIGASKLADGILVIYKEVCNGNLSK